MFRVDSHDPAPIYAQLERAIRTAIAAGQLSPGDQLPTVRQLAVQLKVNANTVARVYSTLEHDGVVETHRGIGTFVRELRSRSARFIADMVSLGFSVRDVIAHLDQTYHTEKE
jgi:GntR family transcriptional regulator